MPSPPLKYDCGTPVRVGDRVSIKRFLWWPYVGTVAFVYDPTLPSPQGGNNDYGFTVDLGDDSYIFVGGVDSSIRLLSGDS